MGAEKSLDFLDEIHKLSYRTYVIHLFSRNSAYGKYLPVGYFCVEEEEFLGSVLYGSQQVDVGDA